MNVLDASTAYDRLRSEGLRLTPQRRAVIEALAGDTSHPSADALASRLGEAMPGMSLSTLYKVLNELTRLGLIRGIDVDGVTRFDPDEADHVHIVCDDCGNIVDAAMPADVTAGITRTAERRGVSARRVDVVVRGRCAACAR